MTYKDFNEKVLRFYLSRANSSFFTFSIDQSEFMSIVSDKQIPLFERLKSAWSLLLKEQDGIPQYFGIIALQCYAGSKMEEDDTISERVYNARLLQVLHLEGMDVQELYKDGNPDDPAQERIWFSAREYMTKNHGLKLNIPERRVFSRRYVQFPISQVLLNTEDLKQFTIFFAEHFIVGENIPYPFFREKLIKWIDGRISPRCMRILSNEEKKEKCLEQVFNYYQHWDGIICKKEVSNNNGKKKGNPNTFTNSRIYLSFIDGIPRFILNNQIVDIDTIFNLKNYFYFHKGILLFSPLKDYDDDHEDSHWLLRANCEYYMVIDRLYDQTILPYLERLCLSKTPISEDIWLLKVKVDDNVPDCLSKYFYEVNPVQLRYGVKLNQSNFFLKGFGPSIEYAKPFYVFCNSHPIVYDQRNANVGKYTVRTDDYKDVHFYIEYPPDLIFIPSCGKGWDLRTFSTSLDWSMEGCLIKLTTSNTRHPIRDWINIVTSQSLVVTNEKQNLLLRILNNARIQEIKNKRNT